jgi:hypothetical protein
MRKAKIVTPLVAGLSFIILGGWTAQAQTVAYPYTYAYPSWQICPNTTFGYGYGSPQYYPYCGIASQSPGALPDPYREYRPYSANVGPKPST